MTYDTPVVADISVAKVRRFCDRNVRARARIEMGWSIVTRSRSVTIHEHRPPWRGAPDPGGRWSKRDGALFRCGEGRLWTLYRANGHGRSLRLPVAITSRDIDDLIHIVGVNRTGAFG